MTISSEIHDILEEGIEPLEDKKHPTEGDAMYMLGRAVAAIEHLAARMDEMTTRSGS